MDSPLEKNKKSAENQKLSPLNRLTDRNTQHNELSSNPSPENIQKKLTNSNFEKSQNQGKDFHPNMSYIQKHFLLPQVDEIEDIGYNPYMIPPDKKITENFKKASKFGFIIDTLGDICNVCHLPLLNRDYNFTNEEDQFQQNGHSFELYFKFSFFSICFIFGIALLPFIFVLMGLNKSGKMCTRGREIHSDKSLKNFDLRLENSSKFEKNVNKFSSGLLIKYGKKTCSKKNMKYQTYCKKYEEIGCVQFPKSGSCLDLTSEFYKSKFVSNSCSSSWYSSISLGNRISKSEPGKKDEISEPRYAIQHLVFFVLLFMILGFEYWQKKKQMEIESNAMENSKIYLKITGLSHGPIFKNYPIAEEIVRLFGDFGYVIANISFAYDLDEYLQTKQNIEEIKNRQAKANFKGYGDELNQVFSQNSALLNKEKLMVSGNEKKILYFEKLFRNDDPEYMMGTAYIGFDSVMDRDSCYFRALTEFDGMKKNLFLRAKNQIFSLEVDTAEVPDNIIWRNLKHSGPLWYARKLVSFFICLVAIFIGYYILQKIKIRGVNPYLFIYFRFWT